MTGSIATFVDPRTDPDHRAPRPPAGFTRDPNELAELRRLCREGRLYDVERWEFVPTSPRSASRLRASARQ